VTSPAGRKGTTRELKKLRLRKWKEEDKDAKATVSRNVDRMTLKRGKEHLS